MSLQANLAAVVRALTPWQLDKADQGGNVPRPQEAHVVYRYSFLASGSTDEIVLGNNVDIVDKVRTNAAVRMELSFYGPNSEEEVVLARQRMGSLATKAIMEQRNLAFGQVYSIQNISAAMLGGVKEERYMMEFIILCTLTMDDDQGRITRIEIDGQTDNFGFIQDLDVIAEEEI